MKASESCHAKHPQKTHLKPLFRCGQKFGISIVNVMEAALDLEEKMQKKLKHSGSKNNKEN